MLVVLRIFILFLKILDDSFPKVSKYLDESSIEHPVVSTFSSIPRRKKNRWLKPEKKP